MAGIIEGGAAYGLALSVDTGPAHDRVRRKQGSHALMPDVPVLELYVGGGRHQAGPFWLYHPDQVEELWAFMDRQANPPGRDR